MTEGGPPIKTVAHLLLATFDGEVYEGSLVRMKTLAHIIGVRKEIRTKIGKQPRDVITVTIRERP